MKAGPDIVTHGCRLNAAESDVMRRLATDAGLSDAVIVNSCAVTAEAVCSARKAVRRARRERPGAKIVVAGCAAQTESAAFAAMPEVDAVLGNDDKLAPGSWRRLAAADAPSMLVNDIMAVRETSPQMMDAYGDRARAFLQIQNGCDHRCTFCVIPYGRGNSRSAPARDIVERARAIVGEGYREIVLTGVDISSYADPDGLAPTLGRLVEAILDGAPDLFRLRLSSVDGAEIDEALFERVAGDDRVAPYLHLSLQSGDDLILKRMKRRHSRSQAIALCEALRARRPEIAFGADIIAGFPTETDAMFENSLSLIEEAGIQFAHIFPYSPREGTPAAHMPQVARETVKARAARLRAAGAAAHEAFLNDLKGRIEDAVVESGGRARLGNFASVKLVGAARFAPGAVARLRLGERVGEMVLGAPA